MKGRHLRTLVRQVVQVMLMKCQLLLFGWREVTLHVRPLLHEVLLLTHLGSLVESKVETLTHLKL